MRYKGSYMKQYLLGAVIFEEIKVTNLLYVVVKKHKTLIHFHR